MKTVREASIAIDGLRWLIKIQTWIIGGAATAGIIVGGWLLNKTSTLSESAVRIETKLESIEKNIDRLAQARSSNATIPSPTAFKGWYGVQTKDPKEVAKFFATQNVDPNKTWVYVGDPEAAVKLLDFVKGEAKPPK